MKEHVLNQKKAVVAVSVKDNIKCKRFEDDLWIKDVRGLCFNL